MPFVSKQQQKWAHTQNGQRALGGKDKVDEWDQSTDFGSLPDKVEGIISKSLKRKAAAPAGILSKRFRSK